MDEKDYRLFGVEFPVRPKPGNHLFWRLGYGVLHVFVTGTEKQESLNRSFQMVQLLNFEVAKPPFNVHEIPIVLTPDGVFPFVPDTKKVLEWALLPALAACGNGIAFYLNPADVGTDMPPNFKFEP